MILNVSEILLFQSHSEANLLQFDAKKIFTFRNVNEHRERIWQTSGKKTFQLRGRFSFHIV